MSGTIQSLEIPANGQEALTFNLAFHARALGKLHIGAGENGNVLHIFLELEAGHTIEAVQNDFGGGPTILRVYVKQT